MKKFLEKQIQQSNPKIEYLEVQAFEMNMYLIKLVIDGEEGMLYGKDDRPVKFNASQQIRDFFENCEVEKSAMIHDSPYDEMVGNPNKGEGGMVLPFSMEHPY